jgi:hypothetical protein
MQTRRFNQVFTVLTNSSSDIVGSLYRQIRAGAGDLGSTCLLYHNEAGSFPEAFVNTWHFCFTNDILKNLNYQPIENKLVPGSNHFPLLNFYLQYPNYDHYWFIEDDVRFNGNWAHLFQFFTSLKRQPDFISCCVRHYDEEPGWYWWPFLQHHNQHIPLMMRIASFNPIYRISNAALNFIHCMLIEKWMGHHEVLVPTLLYYNDFFICDFGGTGAYVLPGTENKFYISSKFDPVGEPRESTMRYRPCIDTMDKANKLYHPVKFHSLA